MTEKKIHVYRLDVVYPKGSLAPGWEPSENWDYYTNLGIEREFKWPRNRLYLSHEGALRRAALFQQYGAYVSVHRSNPVEFDERIPPNEEALRQWWIDMNTQLGNNVKIEID